MWVAALIVLVLIAVWFALGLVLINALFDRAMRIAELEQELEDARATIVTVVMGRSEQQEPAHPEGRG